MGVSWWAAGGGGFREPADAHAKLRWSEGGLARSADEGSRWADWGMGIQRAGDARVRKWMP
eukprot:3908423-Alexandrium_andersonii.AAC.1